MTLFTNPVPATSLASALCLLWAAPAVADGPVTWTRQAIRRLPAPDAARTVIKERATPLLGAGARLKTRCRYYGRDGKNGPESFSFTVKRRRGLNPFKAAFWRRQPGMWIETHGGTSYVEIRGAGRNGALTTINIEPLVGQHRGSWGLTVGGASAGKRYFTARGDAMIPATAQIIGRASGAEYMCGYGAILGLLVPPHRQLPPPK